MTAQDPKRVALITGVLAGTAPILPNIYSASATRAQHQAAVVLVQYRPHRSSL
jgi:hypothetical protein